MVWTFFSNRFCKDCNLKKESHFDKFLEYLMLQDRFVAFLRFVTNPMFHLYRLEIPSKHNLTELELSDLIIVHFGSSLWHTYNEPNHQNRFLIITIKTMLSFRCTWFCFPFIVFTFNVSIISCVHCSSVL